MPAPSKLRRTLVFAVAFVSGLWVCDHWLTTRSIADDIAPTTAAALSAASQPVATRPSLSPEVQAIVDRMAAAYRKLPVRLEATMDSDFDVAGVKDQKSIQITGIADSTSLFRHQAKDQLLITADGERLQVYDIVRNATAGGALQAADDSAATLRSTAYDVMLQQNPALYVALGHDPVGAVSFEGNAVRLLPAGPGDASAFDVLESGGDGTTRQLWLDHASGRIDRVIYDFTKTLASHGVEAIKQARVTLRYTQTDLGSQPSGAAAFAFAPPADATPLRLAGDAEGRAEVSTEALVGKPAPKVVLKDLDGKPFDLADAKGKVVVLNFWATWCPACREEMPDIEQVAKDEGGQDVKLLAVNASEVAEDVKAYIEKSKLSLRVLLDPDGGVNTRYGIDALPTTIVIGRDGRVRKVIIGEVTRQALTDAIHKSLAN